MFINKNKISNNNSFNNINRKNYGFSCGRQTTSTSRNGTSGDMFSLLNSELNNNIKLLNNKNRPGNSMFKKKGSGRGCGCGKK